MDRRLRRLRGRRDSRARNGKLPTLASPGAPPIPDSEHAGRRRWARAPCAREELIARFGKSPAPFLNDAARSRMTRPGTEWDGSGSSSSARPARSSRPHTPAQRHLPFPCALRGSVRHPRGLTQGLRANFADILDHSPYWITCDQSQNEQALHGSRLELTHRQ